jgi:hypothetical protein
MKDIMQLFSEVCRQSANMWRERLQTRPLKDVEPSIVKAALSHNIFPVYILLAQRILQQRGYPLTYVYHRLV